MCFINISNCESKKLEIIYFNKYISKEVTKAHIETKQRKKKPTKGDKAGLPVL